MDESTVIEGISNESILEATEEASGRAYTVRLVERVMVSVEK